MSLQHDSWLAAGCFGREYLSQSGCGPEISACGGTLGEGIPEVTGGLLAGFVPGRRVAGYLIEEQVGAGGMAVVFRAVDGRLGRRVALKVLAPALAQDGAFRERFIRESRAAAAVDDPHIIPVHEAGEADGVLFIAMRLVPGRDARTLLHEEGPLPAGRVAVIVSQVASALDAAHGAGLVHRDVKPANMLVHERPGRPDHVYLSDFGLSKGMLSAAGLTASGMYLGTPGYTAPEQIQGGAVDGRADQYALGCTAFELLAGGPPFERDQGLAVIWAHLSEQPPAVSARRPGLPVAVDAVVARALSKNPGDRYPTCGEFADAFASALLAPADAAPGPVSWPREPTVIAAPVAPPPRPGPPPRTGPAGQDAAGGQDLVTVASRRPGPGHPAGAIPEDPGEPGRGSDAVIAIAFAPDGATFAAGSDDGSLHVYDTADLVIAADLTVVSDGQGDRAVESVAYSPDGSLLAAGLAGGSVRLWDARGQQAAGSLAHPDSAGVNSVAFHPDGTLLAAADKNGSIHLWDIPARRLAGELTIPDSVGVFSVAFSPDGTRLAACDRNGSAYLWELGASRLLASLRKPNPGPMFCAAFTADSSVLATGDTDGTIWLWGADSGKQIGKLARRHSSGVFALAFDPHSFDAYDLAAGYGSGEVCVWDVTRTSRRPGLTLEGPEVGAARAVAFSPDGNKLAVGYEHGRTVVWDLDAWAAP